MELSSNLRYVLFWHSCGGTEEVRCSCRSSNRVPIEYRSEATLMETAAAILFRLSHQQT
jgi:hypothetical protein